MCAKILISMEIEDMPMPWHHRLPDELLRIGAVYSILKPASLQVFSTTLQYFPQKSTTHRMRVYARGARNEICRSDNKLHLWNSRAAGKDRNQKSRPQALNRCAFDWEWTRLALDVGGF
jgi:hypothetical protein